MKFLSVQNKRNLGKEIIKNKKIILEVLHFDKVPLAMLFLLCKLNNR